jgi:hypothetical protein
MAVTQNNSEGDGSKVLFNFTFPYLAQTDVKVKLDGVDTTAYSFANATTVQMDSAPADGVKVIVYRNTDNDNKKATFYPGSAIKAEDLNNNIDQILYVAQEVDNNALSTLGTSSMQGNLQLGEDNTIVFEGATADAHETSIGVIDPTADRTINFPNVSGNVVTTGDSGTVTSTMITDGTIVNDDINASAAIAQSKLNIANATTSAAGYQSAADKTKLDGIETGATADQTNAEIRAAVEAASDSNVFTDADHTKLNNIETAATADQTAAEIRTLVGDASNSNVFTDADNTKLAGIETAATADQTASEIKSLIASSPLDASHLAADSVTTSELADAELTTLAGMQSGTASILADSTALTSTTAELNQLDGKTLGETTLTTNSDTAIPTSKAVNDRILTVTNALGGFVAIANETSFPATHPDPSDGAGTVVSVSDAGGVVVNGSGVASITNGAGSGNTVTINGFPSSLYSKTLEAGIGIQVQTTTTLHTYDYHKILAKETDVEQLSSDINDFKARYRIASSAPASENDDGDLYYDTTAKKMKVYNGATSQWDDVAQSSSSYIVTLSEAFDNSRTSFTMSTAATDAQSTIVSINGVIQKPNAGTSQPSEGFAINGNQLVLAAAPPTDSTAFVVVLGDTVSIGTPSDNTVSTIKIQNQAINNDKVNNSAAIDGSKINPDFGSQDITSSGKINIGSSVHNTRKLAIHDTTNAAIVIEGASNGSSSILFADENDEDVGYITYNHANDDLELLAADDIIIKAADDAVIQVQGGENAVLCNGNGGVELFYDAGTYSTPKLETTSTGATVNGLLTTTGNVRINGTPIWAETGGDYGNLSVRGTTASSSGFINLGNGAAATNSEFDLARIKIHNGATEVARITGITGDGNNDSGEIWFATQASGGSLTTALVIDKDQNVGIGTDSPSGASGKILEINGGSGQARLVLKNDTTGSASTDGHQIYSSGNILGIQNREDSDIVFETGGSERLRVANDGKVYFGDYADPATKAYIEASGDSPWPLTISASSSDSVDRAIIFRLRPGHKAAEFDTNGHLKFPAGHGINFSDYATSGNPSSNLLDDYEEGTWTPAAAFATSGSVTSTGATGKYTKIGNLVYIDMKFYTTAISSPSGAFSITGLPFDPINDTFSKIGISIGFMREWATDMPNFRGLIGGSAQINFYKQATNSGLSTTVQGSDFATGDSDNYIYAQACYVTPT